jgi:hypothetical protein
MGHLLGKLLLAAMILAGGYLIYVVLKAWALVRTAPRMDMFICPKGHGPLAESSLISFMGEKFCPICFHNRLKQAERGELRP